MNDWVNELKMRCDIVTVIGNYVQLTKKGRNFWGRCPFHVEKTASFSVNTEGQFYKCFGCGEHGDVIKFVMEVEHLSFFEAAKMLAEKVNFTIPDLRNDEHYTNEIKQKERYTDMMRAAAIHYYKNIHSVQGKKQYDYLIERGLTKETMDKFALGASLGSNQLIDYLTNMGYQLNEMNECGLIDYKDKKPYDALYGRVIFPIFDNYGKCVAFGGRAMVNGSFAKYKNTRESAVFHKSNVVYGLHHLKNTKKEEPFDDIIMVEGYMDVIGLYQYGVKNAVASMGTALTDLQAGLISRYTKNVYIAYDGDGAGKKATERGLDILYKKGLNVRVISFPDGLDPDEFVKAKGKEAFNELKANALGLFDYKIELLKKRYDLMDNDGRGRFTRAAINEIKLIDDILQAMPYIKKISDIAGIKDIDYLINEFNKKNTANSDNSPVPLEKLIAIKSTGTNTAYTKALDYALYCIATRKPFVDMNDSLQEYILDEEYSKIYTVIMDCYAQEPDFETAALYSKLDGSDAFVKIMSAPDMIENDTTLQSFYKDSISQIKEMGLQLRLKNLSDMSSKAQSNEDKKEILQKINNIHKLIKIHKGGR